MNLIDALVVALLLFGATAGWRAGFLGPVLALAAGVAGFGLAIGLATVLREQLGAIEQPTRALVTILGVSGLVVGGEAIGAAMGATLSRGLRATWFKPLDALGGAVVGAAHVVFLVWIFGGLLAAGVSPSLAPAARESVAMRLVDQRLPSPAMMAGRLLGLVSGTDLPQLFAGLEPPPAAPVELPQDAETQALAQSAIPSTVLVEGSGCSVWLQVGSGFFVGPQHVLTNAHVVAGTDAATVTLQQATFAASVVLFDPDADLALLHVPEANAPALQLSNDTVQRGQTGVALGYPGGRGLSVIPAAVTANHEVLGPNIYGEGEVEHAVIELRADVERGSSGGPLVVAPGVVGGVIFGESRAAADVGYAIAAPAAAERIGPGLGRTEAVDTGPCG